MGRDVKRISRRPVDPVATEGQAPGEKGPGSQNECEESPENEGKGDRGEAQNGWHHTVRSPPPPSP